MNLTFTAEAIADLVRLREFIAAKNPRAAQRAANEILAGLERLKLFPRMGLPVSSAPDPDSIRDLFIGDYTARYLLATEQIIILRVWHSKENENDS